MNTVHDDSNVSAAVRVGREIRSARKRHGWTIAELADRLGRPREWLNRIELGYSEYGEYKPASASDLATMLDMMPDDFTLPASELMTLGRTAEREYQLIRNQTPDANRTSLGKLTQTEVIIGEKQIVRAITELVREQHSDAIIRNTGIKTPNSYSHVSEDWKQYRAVLGEFLASNPNALFKRVEYVADDKKLEEAHNADLKLAGPRELEQVHNAKVKFMRNNPLLLHAIIGQREAILALPPTSGQAGSNMALLIRDKIFVEALRTWYDEVLWDAPGENKSVDFQNFEDSFGMIRQMYGFGAAEE